MYIISKIEFKIVKKFSVSLDTSMFLLMFNPVYTLYVQHITLYVLIKSLLCRVNLVIVIVISMLLR